ncbi:4-hydroxyphenylpyruvate dioxygenase-like protein [Lissotriton helveticus]
MSRLLSRISHITFQVKNGLQLASYLVNGLRFQLFAVRISKGARQFAFKQGSAIFVVNETSPEEQGVLDRSILRGESIGWIPNPPKEHEMESTTGVGLLYDGDFSTAVDTASNVCFEVEDVDCIFQHLCTHKCRIMVPPTTVEDDEGFVTYFVVKSVVGNVCHTLVDRSRYQGEFLPGFQKIESHSTQLNGVVTHFDHVAFASPRLSTPGVLEWYEKCFGFKRFQLSPDEKPGEGYVIQGSGVGLRLTAMQYWKCSKVGLSFSSEAQEKDCKFVIGESLPEQGRNQVDTFLEQHGGAGIQHVGLYTPDILVAAKALRDAGVRFVTPPSDYYSEVSKETEIREVGLDLALLSQLGILLDGELKGSETHPLTIEARKRYLMQIFTHPIFSEDTFFLELIQRHGASGFGEGNIRALWKAIQAYMDRQDKTLTQ